MSVFPAASRRIFGVLAPPRVSRNNNFYLPQELARADGLVVPLYLDHEDFETVQGHPTGRILAKEARGKVKLIWNQVMKRLEYAGQVWDATLQKLIASGQRPHVSLAAEPRSSTEFMGVNVPLNLQFFSVAAVQDPGIPESTLNMEKLLEAYIAREAPVMLEAANTDRMVLLEFDSSSVVMDTDVSIESVLKHISEHDFDKAILALQHMDQVLDKSKAIDAKNAAPAAGPAAGSGMGVKQQATDGPQQHPDDGSSLIPQGYDKLTPMRGQGNQRSGLPGVTGTSNITPMQGDGQEPRGVPDSQPMNRFGANQTGMDQQLMKRPPPRLPVNPVGTIDNMNATGTGVAREGSEANITEEQNARSDMSSAEAEQARGKLGAAQPDDYSADQGPVAGKGKPNSTAVKNIGMGETPFEALRSKVAQGTATLAEISEFARLSEKYDPRPGDRHSSPNQLPTGATDEKGQGSVREDDEADKKMEEEAAGYGFTKEQLKDMKSTYTKSEWPKAWEGMKRMLTSNPSLKEYVRNGRIEASGVRSDPTGGSRESRDMAVSPLGAGSHDTYGLRQQIVDKSGQPNLEKHIAVIKANDDTTIFARSWTPSLSPPPVYRGKGLGPRLEFMDSLEDYSIDQRRLLSESRTQLGLGRHTGGRVNGVIGEAIATTTSGAAMAVDGAVPALIVPTNLAALLRDTTYFQEIEQGSDRVRFQTVTVPTAGALTQNTEPSQATQTLTTTDITPTPRGVEQQLSFEAERKILGPILEGIILSFRVSELYDEDYLLLGQSQAFESGVLTASPAAAGPYSTYNQIFGTGQSAENAVTSAMTFTLAMLTDAQDQMSLDGYSLDNLVAALRPEQYRKLMQDSNVNRLISFGPNTTPGNSWVAQGVIPELVGFEIRRSTLGYSNPTGGSGGIATYHAWCYKKAQTAGLAASRDLMVETFRDIRANSTWIKAHWDFAYGLLQPKSLIEVVSA